MQLAKVKGSTFYVKGGTNTGIYVYNANKAIIIDPGLAGTRPKRLSKIIEENNLKLTYILNTHEHDDHYGGCYELKSIYPDAKIVSSEKSKIFIENPEMFSQYIMGGKSNSLFEKKLRNKSEENIYIDEKIEDISETLKEKGLEIIDLKGHTIGSVGVITQDKVIFVGDTLVGEEIITKYDFLFLYDIEEELRSFEKIRSLDFEYLVLSHSKKILNKIEVLQLIDIHIKAIQKYLDQIKEELKNPITVENLLKSIITKNNLSNNYKEYHFYKSSLVSIISYLQGKDEIDYTLDNGELLYYTKRK